MSRSEREAPPRVSFFEPTACYASYEMASWCAVQMMEPRDA